MEIKIIGGCACSVGTFIINTRAALEELNIDTQVEHINDIQKVLEYGIMNPPALLVGDQILSEGKILNKEEIISLLKTN